MITAKNTRPHSGIVHFRNIIAVLSSIIPGMGHIYKAHYLTGLELIIVSPFIIWTGVLIGIGTLGLGLVIPLIFLISVAWHAYAIEDLRHHHMAGLF